MLPATMNRNRNILLMDQKPHITIQEFYLLIDACNQEYERKTRKGIRGMYIRDRNSMLMELMWVTGGRVSDVLNLKVSDIDTYNKRIRFYVQKRKHTHSILIEADVLLHIQNYLNKWNIKNHLFGAGPDKEPITRQAVNMFLDEYGKTAQIQKKVHPHLFRHGCAVRLVEAGIPIEVVAYYLDHASTTTTTQFYARITDNVANTVIFEKINSMLG